MSARGRRWRATTLDHNLPAQPTRLIGREADVRAAGEMLARGELRLLTLLGPGGVGKTRLALQVAETLRPSFEDGAWFVDLAPLADAVLVLPTVARTLGVPEVGPGPPIEVLTRRLRAARMLLVLDNVEHVLAAAPEIAELLARCPGLKVLATSRAPLGLRWEQLFPVSPLAVPPAASSPGPGDAPGQELLRWDAFRLFVERVRAIRPDFVPTGDDATAVGELCRRLDGLPLALELAAAGLRLHPLRDVLASVGHGPGVLTAGRAFADAPPRHRTMRDAIGWSVVLLAPPVRALFCRLGVFAGGFTLEAVEAVCGAGSAGGVVDLVDASLLQRGEDGRFAMLQIVRELALDLLSDPDARDVRARHAAWCLEQAEQGEQELIGPRQVAWRDRLGREHDNMRVALDWLEQIGRVGAALRLAAALSRFWSHCCYVAEGRARLARLLERDAGAEPADRARALYAAGDLAFRHGDSAAAWAAGEECRRLSQAVGDRHGEALGLKVLLWTSVYRNDDPALQRRLAEETLTLNRALGDEWGVASALSAIGSIELWVGAHAEAEAAVQQALDINRRIGDERSAAAVLMQLSLLASATDDHAAARAHAAEALAVFEQAGDQLYVGFALARLGQAALDLGDRAAAADCFARALAVHRMAGHPVRVATLLGGLATLCRTTGRRATAARLLGAATTLGRQRTRPPAEAGHLEREIALVRAALGETVWRTAWAEGAAMTFDEAAALGAAAADELRADLKDGGPPAAGPPRPNGLTPREVEVAALLARGLTNRQIADELVIAPGTAGLHVKHVLAKLGVRSRAQAAAWAVRTGLGSG